MAAQEIGLYPTMTGRSNLNFFGRLAGMESQTRRRRIDELAQSLDLAPLLDKPTQSLSGGQRRRLHAAIAMLHRPGLLWLDEPTAGADIQSRQQLLSEVRRFADEGGAVVYATHYFPEVEMLGASIAILHRGRIVARGSSESITSAHVLPSIMLEFAGDLPEHLRGFASAGAGGTETRVVIPVRHPASDLAQVVCNLGEGADRLLSVELRRPGLESAFLRLTDGDKALDEEKTADVLTS